MDTPESALSHLVPSTPQMYSADSLSMLPSLRMKALQGPGPSSCAACNVHTGYMHDRCESTMVEFRPRTGRVRQSPLHSDPPFGHAQTQSEQAPSASYRVGSHENVEVAIPTSSTGMAFSLPYLHACSCSGGASVAVGRHWDPHRVSVAPQGKVHWHHVPRARCMYTDERQLGGGGHPHGQGQGGSRAI